MYIHSYQIHNVLNEYRKQLRQSPSVNEKRRPQTETPRDRVDLSIVKQRESIIEQVSNDIVERLKHTGSIMSLNNALSERLDSSNADHALEQYEESDFIYSYINEHNQKMTNTFSLQNLKTIRNTSRDSGPTPRESQSPDETSHKKNKKESG